MEENIWRIVAPFYIIPHLKLSTDRPINSVRHTHPWERRSRKFASPIRHSTADAAAPRSVSLPGRSCFRDFCTLGRTSREIERITCSTTECRHPRWATLSALRPRPPPLVNIRSTSRPCLSFLRSHRFTHTHTH